MTDAVHYILLQFALLCHGAMHIDVHSKGADKLGCSELPHVDAIDKEGLTLKGYATNCFDHLRL